MSRRPRFDELVRHPIAAQVIVDIFAAGLIYAAVRLGRR